MCRMSRSKRSAGIQIQASTTTLSNTLMEKCSDCRKKFKKVPTNNQALNTLKPSNFPTLKPSHPQVSTLSPQLTGLRPQPSAHRSPPSALRFQVSRTSGLSTPAPKNANAYLPCAKRILETGHMTRIPAVIYLCSYWLFSSLTLHANSGEARQPLGFF
jgi:hypothetical protein